MACAQILADRKFFIDSEVGHEPTGNIADIVAYGHESRNPIVVELDTVYDRDVALANVEKYQHGPIYDVITVPVDTLSTEIKTMHNEIQEQWL
jgi:hypothetical protein